MSTFYSYKEFSKKDILEKALYWANSCSHFSFHQNNEINYPHNGFLNVLAIGAKRVFNGENGQTFEGLKEFHQNQWLFGYLGYDLKNEVEKLSSNNIDLLNFPPSVFFEPEHLIFFENNGFRVESANEKLIEEIIQKDTDESNSAFSTPTPSVTREDYIETVQKLRWHIEEGDCYEINFCQEFHGKVEQWSPVQTYLQLNTISPKPFSCFQKFEDHYILCASPERFIKKEGDKIISQPIKGTRPRMTDPEADLQQKTELRLSEKEIAENMMIVDLVRNDLARTSKTGSIKVEEMFGIYSFQQVHQMISTIVSEQMPDMHFVDVIRNAFPMGSMTGAPKVKVMQLIEQYENTKRGAFSGAAGYIKASGDFDFNVLIRSLFVNSQAKTYSFQVGSAITYDSDPEEEYKECLVKAKALFEILSKK